MTANGSISTDLSRIPAIVLCGGKGTRLQRLTNDQIPKALVQIGARTLLDHTLDLLCENGIREVILAMSHHAHKIKSHLQTRSNDKLNIGFSETAEPLGVLPSIMMASSQFRLDSTFLIAGADEICSGLDLAPVYAFHQKTSALATIVLTERIISEHSSLKAEIDRQGRITSLARGTPVSEYTATGIAFLEPGFIARAQQIHGDLNSKEDAILATLLPKLIAEQRIYGSVCPMLEYMHISTPEAYMTASQSKSQAATICLKETGA
jgi:NDP-sugar pyrophosphorylase family protein